MLKETVEYTDFNGNVRTEELYFNLSHAQLLRLEVEFEGGLEKYIESLDPEKRPQDVLAMFERLLLSGYGEKSEDGRLFRKSEEIVSAFKDSAAYEVLLLSLLKNGDKAAAFFNGLVTTNAVSQN